MKSLYTLSLLLFLCTTTFGQSKCLSGSCTSGMGTYKWDDGSEYTGQWSDGKRTGLGVYDWAGGAFYYGYFVDGKLEGRGVYIGVKKEDDLVGTFHDGKFSEKTYIDTSGCLLGNCKNGVGVFLWHTGDMYIGDWTNDGDRTGYGRYDWKNGSIYIGYFKKGKLDGEGNYKGNDGKNMKGSFVDGQFQGTTTYDGSKSAKTSVEEKDFCSTVKAVVKEYPNNFVSLKGEKAEYLDNEWDANIKVAGAIYASVYQDYVYAQYNVYESEIYTGTTWDEAYNKYKDYINKKDYCDFGCGPMKSEESKDDAKKKYKITWKPSDSNTYKKMSVELVLDANYSGGYKILLTVNHDYF